jgi:hypothetical protein
MNLISGMAILPFLELILRIVMYFSIILLCIKGVQALNVYIRKNS